MRAFLTLVIGVGVVVVGNYYLNPYVPICRLPTEYSIGSYDERFGLSRDEVLASLKEAEAVWESALGRDDIFTYDDSSRLKVNFIYDERQREAAAAERARDHLDERGEANEVLIELHRRLVEEYEAGSSEYESRTSTYEAALAAYNAKVERYNDEGGAPPDEYARLEAEKADLESERRALNSLSVELNALASRINEIGDKGNELVGEYNDLVSEFNDNFAHGHEYTQGDYRTKDINIYSFTSRDELVMVLAHELGHALSLSHVEDPKALMYYLLKEQPTPVVLAPADAAAFEGACEIGFWGGIWRSLRPLYNGFIN